MPIPKHIKTRMIKEKRRKLLEKQKQNQKITVITKDGKKTLVFWGHDRTQKGENIPYKFDLATHRMIKQRDQR